MATAAEEAAAALAPGMAAQLVEAMPLAGDDALVADLAARSDAAAPAPVPSSQPQTAPEAAAPAPTAEPVVEEEFDLEPVISDELQQLLDEPDFDAEAALEVEAEQENWNENATDPEVAKRLKTLEKRNEWLEERVVTTERKKWVAENLKAYPLLARYAPDEVEKIDATSRRAFARAASGLNTRFATMLKPALDDIEEKKKKLRGEVSQEVRSEYKDGWGEITNGPAAVPVEANELKDDYTRKLKAGNLPGAIGALLRGAGVTNTP